MATRSGCSRLMRFTNPQPSSSAYSRQRWTAAGSPRSAAWKAVLPSTAPFSLATVWRRLRGKASISSSVRRMRPVAEAYCSQQPFRPQVQRRPPKCVTMCPTSPAMPQPVWSFPSRMSPAPMPVPRVTRRKFRMPRPAPRRASPTAAQSASLPSRTGTSRVSRNQSARGTSRSGRLQV